MLSAFSRTTLLLLVFTITLNISFAQPSNDNFSCTGLPSLTPVTSCAIPTPGTLYQATTGNPTSTCGTTYDVWYTFDVPAGTTAVNILVNESNPTSIDNSNTFVEAFSSSGCVLSLKGSCTAIGTTLSLTGLTASTHYLRVFTTTSPTTGNANRWDYNICITYTPPPANDDCSGAINLSNGVTNNSGTVWSATTSTGIPTGCALGNPDDDVWYKFTAAATGTNLNVSLSSIGSNLNTSVPRLQLFSGTCGSLSSIACGTTDITTTVNSGTYYIRVYSNGAGSIGGTATGSAFSITATATTLPTNDDCSVAINLSSGVANTSGTVWLASASSGVSTGCATGTPDDDVWYKFTPAGNSLTVSLSAIGNELNTSGARLQLFSGSCGSLVSIACGTTGITTTVTAGDTYYLRVYSAGTGSIGGTSPGSAFSITATSAALPTVTSSRMKEVFSRTILSGALAMTNPWEVTYGPDEKLWVTDSKGYKVYRIDPNTGAKVTVLDISQFSTTAPDNTFRCQFDNGAGAQGGLAGLVLHPNFLDGTANENNSVYISYIYSGSGSFFTNRLVRFIYNAATDRLVSPVSICDSLPGSNDHNSQRMIIAPEVAGGTKYLFYASGDMGAGQGNTTNRARTIRAQFPDSYEGKILRFNLEEDGDAVQTPATINYNRWIPNDNPYNAMLGKQSAVWNIGQRNNQGFAYDTAAHILYGSSHGAYSDDEINIHERGRNYGHPLVIGFAADGNYNGTTTPSTSTSISAGAPFPVGSGNSTCPPIGNEAANAVTITGNGNGAYKDPLFSCYTGPTGTGAGTVANIWATNPNNSTWPSEGWSGLDLYTNKMIPGWKRSLVASGLKWGRLIRLKLGPNGNTTLPSNLAYQNTSDTVLYFQSSNRYRDIAFGPNGKDIYVIMDNNAASAATDGNPPVTPACAGCLVKYSFLGYADNGGKSTIPTSIDVTAGADNTINQGTTVTIDGTNNQLWVPITGPDGNIMAEINAMGQNLGVVTSSFYTHAGPIRVKKGFHYLDRNITITPAVTNFATPVKVRLYISKAEFDALDANPGSGITSGISQLKILKNDDPCSAEILATTVEIPKTITGVDLVHGTNGYVLQGEVSGFSSFYFAATNITLPVELLTFKGSLQNNSTFLQWKTINENNSSHFVVERSIDGRNFESIGTVAANGNTTTTSQYSHSDNEVTNLSSVVIYYRLKMVDIDNKFKYSTIVTIYLADITNKISLSPNPAKHETKVVITALLSGKAQWKLTDNNGRVIMQDAIHINRGSNNFTINLSRVSGGIYYLNISGAGIDQNVKLQKL